jgi:hypothetical protein
VQSNGLGDGVDQDSIGHGDRDDVGEIEIEEVGAADHGLIGNIANHHQDQEDPCDQV